MPDDDGPATQGEVFQRTQRVALDLREPPTREETGVVAGRNSFIVERSGEAMLDVSLTLPDGTVLAVPAIGVVFSAAPGAGPDAPVERIVVNRVEESLDEAKAAVRAGAEALGIDPADVDSYFADVGSGERVKQVFGEARIGYLRAEIEIRHDPDGTRTAVDYLLSWGSML